jgi:hypothetical protein
MMSDQQTENPLFQYSVKIERSAKGARWTVHCYSNDRQIALNEAVQMYDEVGKKLEESGLGVAPVERSGRD